MEVTLAGFASPDVEIDADLVAALEEIAADLYKVIVLNDDVTTFDTVITALVRLFDHSVEEAEELAQKVDREGLAVVALLPKEEAIKGTEGLHGYKIQARYEKA